MVLKIFAVIVLAFPVSSSRKLRESSINATEGRKLTISLLAVYSTFEVSFLKTKEACIKPSEIENFL